MKLKRYALLYTLDLVLLVLFVFLTYVVYELSEINREFSEKAEILKSLQDDAATMRSASDLLSAQARRFSSSGDISHVDNYFTEKDVTRHRNAAMENVLRKDSDTCVQTSMETALRLSDELIVVELQAMRLAADVHGIDLALLPSELQDVDIASYAALTTEEKKNAVERMLFGPSYQAYKDVIYDNIVRTVAILNDRTFVEKADFSERLGRTTLYEIILILSILCVLALMISMLVVRTKKTETVLNRVALDRFRFLSCLSQIYHSSYRIDFAKNSCEVLASDGPCPYAGLPLDKAWGKWLETGISSTFYEQNTNFLNFATLPVRLTLHGVLSEDVLTTNDGWMNVTFVPYRRDTEGNVVECLMQTRIIDDIKKEELRQLEALEAANRAARSASAAKSRFLFSMSHDIRTPLNAIIGFSGIARAHLDDREKADACLARVQKSGQHLLQLINNVLDLAQIEGGRETTEVSLCSIAEEVEKISVIVQPMMQQKNITFSLNVDNAYCDKVYADVLHINQVLINLLGNAVKFTPENGTVSLSVKLSAAPRRNYAVCAFSVRDTGIGMSPEFMEKLFTPFEQARTSTVSRTEGSGLGMAIANHLADMLGSSIRVKSELGVGTEFLFDVELKVAEQEKQESEAGADRAAENCDLTKLRILMAEDNEVNRELMADIFTDMGIHIDTAENGREAADMLLRSAPGTYDLVLMDIQMPVMDGYEATRLIRSAEGREDLHTLPILALSANAFAEDKKRSLACGMNDHLSKPVKTDVLLAALRRFASRASA